MSKKDCTNCNYAEWDLLPSGERLLNNYAYCKFPKIQFPNSYLDNFGTFPTRCKVTKDTKEDCLFWGEIK